MEHFKNILHDILPLFIKVHIGSHISITIIDTHLWMFIYIMRFSIICRKSVHMYYSDTSICVQDFPAQLLSIDIIPYCQFLKIIITSSTAKGKGNLKISLQWNEKRLFICKTLSENTTRRCGDFRDKRLGDKSDTHNFA